MTKYYTTTEGFEKQQRIAQRRFNKIIKHIKKSGELNKALDDGMAVVADNFTRIVNLNTKDDKSELLADLLVSTMDKIIQKAMVMVYENTLLELMKEAKE